jgi:hypothetical protein
MGEHNGHQQLKSQRDELEEGLQTARMLQQAAAMKGTATEQRVTCTIVMRQREELGLSKP